MLWEQPSGHRASRFWVTTNGHSSTKCGTCHLRRPEGVPSSKWPGPPVLRLWRSETAGGRHRISELARSQSRRQARDRQRWQRQRKKDPHTRREEQLEPVWRNHGEPAAGCDLKREKVGVLGEGLNKAEDEPRSLREARQPIQRGRRGPRTELSLSRLGKIGREQGQSHGGPAWLLASKGQPGTGLGISSLPSSPSPLIPLIPLILILEMASDPRSIPRGGSFTRKEVSSPPTPKS